LNADSDSLVNGSCASSEDLNQTNSSEQGEKITSGSDDEGGYNVYTLILIKESIMLITY